MKDDLATTEQAMNVQTRLEANAILDRLVADGSTFSRNDALRLIELIPVTPVRGLRSRAFSKDQAPASEGMRLVMVTLNLRKNPRRRRSRSTCRLRTGSADMW
ncbi:hypothetical protein BB934_32315 (plasmid) [Microvirga ossetica]|uniref:Uncharacterized protein n=1 Tax=Microvirga ossetica TaxID=1882682 RepID=A0A1B2ESH3_9HYPH|nr:hypothetical protein [Microvirga ossetica]ANY82909.1 hypothetical protein BB934_32315 [Microvirga ossetica]